MWLKSLFCREFEPLTGTQNRDPARMNYRMTHTYLDTGFFADAGSYWSCREAVPETRNAAVRVDYPMSRNVREVRP